MFYSSFLFFFTFLVFSFTFTFTTGSSLRLKIITVQFFGFYSIFCLFLVCVFVFAFLFCCFIICSTLLDNLSYTTLLNIVVVVVVWISLHMCVCLSVCMWVCVCVLEKENRKQITLDQSWGGKAGSKHGHTVQNKLSLSIWAIGNKNQRETQRSVNRIVPTLIFFVVNATFSMIGLFFFILESNVRNLFA